MKLLVTSSSRLFDRLPRWLTAFARVAFTLVLALLVLRGIHSAYAHGVRGVHGARIYYDAYHGAHHLWNRDNGRARHSYHTVSGYFRFYQTLREMGFDVDVATNHGFDRERLEDYDVFYVGEQTKHGNFMTDREVEDLRDWVEDGGGLFVTAEHTNAYYMNDVVNRLLEGYELRVRNDGLTDRKQIGPFSADWVVISRPRDAEPHPIARGVDAYLLFAGCSIDTPHGVLFSSASSWSDHYGAHAPPLFPADGKRQKGEPMGPLPGVAAAQVGSGRVVVVCDHNAFSNPNIYWGDHERFARQSMAWLAGERTSSDVKWGLVAFLLLLVGLWSGRRTRESWWPVGGGAVLALALGSGSMGWVRAAGEPVEHLLFVRSGSAGTRLMTKARRGHYTFYAMATRDAHLRPWVDDTVRAGYDAVVLVAPTDELSDAELAVLDGELAAGKTVLYLANRRSLEAPAGRQLKEHFEFEFELGKVLPMRDGAEQTPYVIEGPGELVDGLFKFWVSPRITEAHVEGLEPVVVLTEESAPEESPRVDLLSERKVGPGTFAVLGPMGLFDTGSLGELYEPPDLIREQMRELSLRVIARTVGHDWAADLKRAR